MKVRTYLQTLGQRERPREFTVATLTERISLFLTLGGLLRRLTRNGKDVVVDVDRHVFLLQARKFESRTDGVRLVVMMDVHPVVVSADVTSVSILNQSAHQNIPRTEDVGLLDVTKGARTEGVVEEAVKRRSVVVKEVMRERHSSSEAFEWECGLLPLQRQSVLICLLDPDLEYCGVEYSTRFRSVPR